MNACAGTIEQDLVLCSFIKGPQTYTPTAGNLEEMPETMQDPSIELTDAGQAWRDQARDHAEQTGIVASHAFSLGFLYGLEAAYLGGATLARQIAKPDSGGIGRRAFAMKCLMCGHRWDIGLPFAGGRVPCPGCGFTSHWRPIP